MTRRPLITLTLTAALACFGCAEDPQGSADSNLGSGTTGPSQGGAPAPSLGGSPDPTLSSAGVEPGSTGATTGGTSCAVEDYSCVCRVLYGRYIACADEPVQFELSYCDSAELAGEYAQDFREDCAEAGLSISACWDIANAFIGACASSTCNEVDGFCDFDIERQIDRIGN